MNEHVPTLQRVNEDSSDKLKSHNKIDFTAISLNIKVHLSA